MIIVPFILSEKKCLTFVFYLNVYSVLNTLSLYAIFHYIHFHFHYILVFKIVESLQWIPLTLQKLAFFKVEYVKQKGGTNILKFI